MNALRHVAPGARRASDGEESAHAPRRDSDSPLVDLNEWLCCLGGHAERIFGLHSAHKLKAALGVTNVFFAGSSRTAFYKTGFCHSEAHRQEALGRIDRAIKRQLKKAAKEAHEQQLLQLVA